MTGDRVADLAAYLLMLTLPLSALAVRRVPFGRTLRLADTWALIFIVVVVLVLIGAPLAARAGAGPPRCCAMTSRTHAVGVDLHTLEERASISEFKPY